MGFEKNLKAHFLFQFSFEDPGHFTKRFIHIARQTALRHIRTSAALAANARDQIASLEPALDEIFGHRRNDG
jgi:hypothetical protein